MSREMLGLPSRIHIIGGPGSGKTTLAHDLGRLLVVPVFTLDAIAEQCGGYGPGFRPLCPVDKRLADVSDIANQPAWITEGTYLTWSERVLSAADLILWLDVSTPSAMWRIVSRHVREYFYDSVRPHNW